MLIKKMVIVLILCSVFAMGTLSFVDTVEASKWKKYDSGKFYATQPDPGYKNTVLYTTFIKGSKEIKMNFYGYKVKNNKKTFIATLYFSKTGNQMKYVEFKNGKKSKPEYAPYKGSVKQYYKSLIKRFKKA